MVHVPHIESVEESAEHEPKLKTQWFMYHANRRHGEADMRRMGNFGNGRSPIMLGLVMAGCNFRGGFAYQKLGSGYLPTGEVPSCEECSECSQGAPTAPKIPQY